MASLYSWPFTTMTCHARSGRARLRPPRPMPATTAQWSSGSSSRPTSTATSTTSGSTRGRPTQVCTSVTSGAPLGSSWPAPHSQDHVGLAAGQLRQPGGRYYGHRVCRVVPHPTLAATVTAAERCRLRVDNSPLHALASGSSGGNGYTSTRRRRPSRCRAPTRPTPGYILSSTPSSWTPPPR